MNLTFNITNLNKVTTFDWFERKKFYSLRLEKVSVTYYKLCTPSDPYYLSLI
jgi:hypothetical protein